MPLLGLPGNPLSALVVFRLVGVPLVWRLAGCDGRRRSRPCGPGWAATWPRRPAGWTSCRSPCATACAEPLFGPSALLSVLARADGYLVVPEPATGLDGGTEVEVILYR